MMAIQIVIWVFMSLIAAIIGLLGYGFVCGFIDKKLQKRAAKRHKAAYENYQKYLDSMDKEMKLRMELMELQKDIKVMREDIEKEGEAWEFYRDEFIKNK